MKIKILAVLGMAWMLLSVPAYGEVLSSVQSYLVVTNFYDALNSGDVGAAVSLLTDDAIVTGQGCRRACVGRKEIASMLQANLCYRCRVEMTTFHKSGDTVVLTVERYDRGILWGVETVEISFEGPLVKSLRTIESRLNYWSLPKV